MTETEQKHREINISIDDYNDLFSDFDAREYSGRAISEDFLHELKKVSAEEETEIELLNLHIHSKNINQQLEEIISKRLQQHFKKNHHHYLQLSKNEQKKGILFLVIGSILLFSATYILLQNNKEILLNALIVILEPAGWFLSWTGLETLFNNTKLKNHNLSFYTKTKKCKVHFISKN